MTFERFFCVLKARWLLVLSVVGCALACAAALSAWMPVQYTASASLLVDMRRAELLASGNAAVGDSADFSTQMATQLDLLQSERVLRKAIRDLRLLTEPGYPYQAQWQRQRQGQGDAQPWLVEQIQQKLEVRPTRDSGVVSLSFTAGDAQTAARIANGIVRAYIDTELELRLERAARHAAFFDERAKRLREAVESARERLSSFQRQAGVFVGNEDRIDIETARLNELSSQLSTIEALAAESRSRERQAQSQGDRAPELVNNSLLQNLSADLVRQQTRLSELGSRLGESHPQVIEAQSGVAQLRARLEAESRRVKASVGVSSNVDEARIAQAREALDKQRERVLRLKSTNDQAAVLLRDVQNAQRNHDAVLVESGRMQVESLAALSNAVVIKEAVPPLRRSAPKTLTHLVIAGVLSLFAALGLVLTLETFDTRLRTEDDVTETLGRPLLAVLPGRA